MQFLRHHLGYPLCLSGESARVDHSYNYGLNLDVSRPQGWYSEPRMLGKRRSPSHRSIMSGFRTPCIWNDIRQPWITIFRLRYLPIGWLYSAHADQQWVPWVDVVQFVTRQLLSRHIHLVCDAGKEIAEHLHPVI